MWFPLSVQKLCYFQSPLAACHKRQQKKQMSSITELHGGQERSLNVSVSDSEGQSYYYYSSSLIDSASPPRLPCLSSSSTPPAPPPPLAIYKHAASALQKKERERWLPPVLRSPPHSDPYNIQSWGLNNSPTPPHPKRSPGVALDSAIMPPRPSPWKLMTARAGQEEAREGKLWRWRGRGELSERERSGEEVVE